MAIKPFIRDLFIYQIICWWLINFKMCFSKKFSYWSIIYICYFQVFNIIIHYLYALRNDHRNKSKLMSITMHSQFSVCVIRIQNTILKHFNTLQSVSRWLWMTFVISGFFLCEILSLLTFLESYLVSFLESVASRIMIPRSKIKSCFWLGFQISN